MNNRLLCYFNFNDYFYEIGIDKNSKILCKKFGTKKQKASISDAEVIKSVIKKISDMKYVFFNEIQYNGEKLRLYLNLFNNKIYISKIDNQKEVACDYDSYKEVYDMYNNPIIYDYPFGRQSPFGNEQSSVDNPFGTQSLFGNGQSSVDNPFESLDEFNTDSNQEDYYTRIEESRRRQAELKRKNKNKNKRIITVVVSGILIVVTVIASIAMIAKFRGNDFETEQNINIEEIIENTEDKVLKKILESLSEEEDWVIEQVIEQYQAQKENSQSEKYLEEIGTGPEKTIKVEEMSKEAKKLIDSISTNNNLTEEEKELIIEYYSIFFENNMKYIKNSDELCDTLNSIKIIYDIKTEEELEELGIGGYYDSKTNEITIYRDSKEVITHEVGHAIGNLGMGQTTKQLTEGYNELFNPNRDSSVYSKEQIIVLILEQIYGKDFMREAYFNQSLFSDIYDRFDIDKGDTNKHWDLIRKCNSLLLKYEDYTLEEIKTDENILKEMEALFNQLKEEYESLTKKEWEKNELLKVCYDRFTGENTSGKNGGEKNYLIRDVYINSDGNYVYRIGKIFSVLVDVTEPTMEDVLYGNTVQSDLYSKTFDIISGEIEI